ncbi:MAG: DNA repair protein RadA [Planctomycetota bacterium]|jgi:DNA repair protein RadA/Sms|nr:DNA repair protein RadA [Deltaproteobacteria bacterium]MDP6540104.1 DNA repair protein RadA [Planctomycetota bacterium]
MARARSIYVCTECGSQSPQMLGRCPGCGSWETLIEEPIGAPPEEAPLVAPASGAPSSNVAMALADVDTGSAPRVATGVGELDRVLGGGLIPGSVVLIGGEPGIGKSTLSLQLAAQLERDAGHVLYVTGEESLEQVRLRAERLGEIPRSLLALSETRVEALAKPWQEHRPSVVVIDSIQTLRTERVESAAGSVAQVRECAALLSATAKSHGTALILVGHVTKEGTLAGPRVLEHLVDVVLNFEGDRGTPFRLLRASKNRFGSTQEVGIFTMGEKGLQAVENPSELFLAERHTGAPGSCIVPVMEGTRPVLLEVQALVAPAGYGTARRTSIGIDDARVALLLAVLDRHSEIDLLSCDVYVNVVGGVRVAEPAADLAVALALASSRLDRPLPQDVAACGEVGLGGEVRRVGRLDQRLREAGRLGFGRVLVPEGVAAAGPSGDGAIGVRNVGEAVRWLFENAAPRGRE